MICDVKINKVSYNISYMIDACICTNYTWISNQTKYLIYSLCHHSDEGLRDVCMWMCTEFSHDALLHARTTPQLQTCDPNHPKDDAYWSIYNGPRHQ